MLIYIMGRGHSGTTILDVILGNSAACESVGELVSGLGREIESEICACGTPMRDCHYWAAARRSFAAPGGQDWHEAARALVRHAHVRNLPRTLLARSDSVEMRRLADLSIAFARAITRATGKEHLVDSSKEPTRGLMLLRFCPEARVIHLVRDPRRLMASNYWRYKEWNGYVRFLRRTYSMPRQLLLPVMLLEVAAWVVGNLLGEVACRMAPERALKMRYEDLCAAPADELGRLARSFGIPLDDVIAKVTAGEELAIGHNVGGNQLRTEGTVTFVPGKGKAHATPRWLALATIACCWPLMLAYGYPLRSSGTRPAASAGAGR